MAQTIGNNPNDGPNDNTLTQTVALPTAGNNVSSGVFDLSLVGTNSDGWRVGRFVVSVPALPNNTSTSDNVNIALQIAPPSLTSATFPPVAGTFAAEPTAETMTITGVATTGSLAKVTRFAIPPNTVGFIKFVITATSGAGNNSSQSATISFEYA